MKKGFLLFMLFSAMTTLAEKVSGVIVELSSGGTLEIAMAYNPKIFFDGKVIKLTATDVNVEYTPSEIKKVRIAEVDGIGTGINASENLSGSIQVEEGFVRLTGFAANEAVEVFSISGVMTAAFRTSANGSCTIDLRSLPSGVSIVKVQKQSIKITRL
jgi:hypothetical protein